MKCATTAVLMCLFAVSIEATENGPAGLPNDRVSQPAPGAAVEPSAVALAANVGPAAATLLPTLAQAPNESPAADGAELEEGWISLFNGSDLSGWKISDDGLWEVRDGMIVAQGPRSHLFTEREFKNFEFKAEVMTTPGSNSGIYFHTSYLETGWPMHGHESQVNVTHGDPVKTGSIYNVVRLYETPAKDNEWWTQYIKVEGQRIIVKINDKIVLDYTEPEGVTDLRRISSGCFALQAHDPKSVTFYRNIRVKPLPD